MIQLIQKQTAEATGKFYFQRDHIGCSVIVDGVLGAAEEITVKYIGLDGVANTVAYDDQEDAQVLALTKPSWGINSACYVEFAKPTTVAAVGLAIHGIG